MESTTNQTIAPSIASVLPHSTEASPQDWERFELAPGAYLITDSEGVIQAANLPARELLGADLQGQNLASLVKPSDQQRFQSLLIWLQRESGSKSQEFSLQSHAGRSFDAGFEVRIAQDAQGKLKELRWWIQDISARKQGEMQLRRSQQHLEQSVAELTANLTLLENQLKTERNERRRTSQTLARSESRFRNLVQHSSDLITILNANGTVQYSSPAISLILGYYPEDRLNRKYFDHVHPDDLDKLQEHFLQLLSAPGFSAPIVYRYEHLSGEWIYLESIYNNLLHDSSVQGIVINSRDSTERRQAELALHQAMDQLRAVLDAVPGAVSWVGSDLRYLGVNRQLARMFNQPPEAFVGQPIGFLETSPQFPEFLHQFFAQPELTASQEVVIEVDGDPHIFLIVGEKYFNNQAGVFVGVDITDRRRTEEALQRSEATNLALVDAMPDLMLKIRQDGTFIDYKAGKNASIQLPPFEFLGRKLTELLPEELSRPALHAITLALKTGDVQFFEFQLLGAHDFEARIVTCGEEEVLAIVRDITQRKQAEEALRQAEERYRRIFENAAEGIFQTTESGQYLSVNLALARIYGYGSPEELMAKISNIGSQLYVEANRRAEFLQLMQQQGQIINFESQVYRQDGTAIWISETVHKVKDRQGDLAYYQGSVQDITDRKQLEETLAGVCQLLLTSGEPPGEPR